MSIKLVLFILRIHSDGFEGIIRLCFSNILTDTYIFFYYFNPFAKVPF